MRISCLVVEWRLLPSGSLPTVSGNMNVALLRSVAGDDTVSPRSGDIDTDDVIDADDADDTRSFSSLPNDLARLIDGRDEAVLLVLERERRPDDDDDERLQACSASDNAHAGCTTEYLHEPRHDMAASPTEIDRRQNLHLRFFCTVVSSQLWLVGFCGVVVEERERGAESPTVSSSIGGGDDDDGGGGVVAVVVVAVVVLVDSVVVGVVVVVAVKGDGVEGECEGD
jgi:hypothetical protein